ncbi:MAG: YceI family protein [Chloroflexi bacterium]|nr:YceI family protein [Chloroflexota bacterium]
MLKRPVPLWVLIVAVLIALGVGSVGGVLGYTYFVGGSGEASRDVSAEGGDSSAAPGATTFVLSPENSQVSFTLLEDLRGVRTTVVGTTNQVGGTISVDLANPENSSVGPIEINLRTLATDNEFRNRAIRAEILESARTEYEFTTFTPTAISGLPERVSVGDTFTFTVTGDLPIRQITNSVTFDVTITLVSETELTGSAEATVLRSAYNLQIPTVPGVANVTDDVLLQIRFAAAAQAPAES